MKPGEDGIIIPKLDTTIIKIGAYQGKSSPNAKRKERITKKLVIHVAKLVSKILTIAEILWSVERAEAAEMIKRSNLL